MIRRDGMEEKNKKEKGSWRSSKWMDDGRRGGRAKLENLIPIDDIHARGPCEFIISNRYVTCHATQSPNVLIGEGCGGLQIDASSPGLHLLALEPDTTSTTRGRR